jgi:hypothetical protein
MKIKIYRTIISPLVLYGCEGRTMIEGVYNRVLRRIFGLKRDEVAAGWRKLHTFAKYY